MTFVRLGLLALAIPLLAGAAQPTPKPSGPPAQTAATKAKAARSAAPAKAAPVKNAKAAPAPDTGDLTPGVSFPGGVTLRPHVYRTLPGFRPLTLDLYQSSAPGFPRPGLVFIHDGDWRGGDSRQAAGFADFPGLLASLAARGFVVASIDYRLSGEARFPAALRDVKSAIGWLRGHAGELNLDATRIAVWGAGTGGYLATMAGVSCGVAKLEPEAPADTAEKPPSDCVQAVIDWYGISDFESLAADKGQPAPDRSPEGTWLGCEPALCAPGFAKSASPLSYVAAMNPPFLIQQGATDAVLPPQQSRTLYDTLHAAGVPAELVTYPDAGHDFGADPAIRQQVIDKVESFLDATFPKKPMNGPYKPVPGKPLPY